MHLLPSLHHRRAPPWNRKRATPRGTSATFYQYPWEESSTKKMTEGGAAAASTSLSSPDSFSAEEQHDKLVVLLYSSMSLHREQAGNYQRALTVLQAKKIPYEAIDAADVQCRPRYVDVPVVCLSVRVDCKPYPTASTNKRTQQHCRTLLYFQARRTLPDQRTTGELPPVLFVRPQVPIDRLPRRLGRYRSFERRQRIAGRYSRRQSYHHDVGQGLGDDVVGIQQQHCHALVLSGQVRTWDLLGAAAHTVAAHDDFDHPNQRCSALREGSYCYRTFNALHDSCPAILLVDLSLDSNATRIALVYSVASWEVRSVLKGDDMDSRPGQYPPVASTGRATW